MAGTARLAVGERIPCRDQIVAGWRSDRRVVLEFFVTFPLPRTLSRLMELTVIDFPTVRRHAHRLLSVSPSVLTVATVCALPTGALPTSASAQAAQPVINGRITDKAGRALEGAIISSSASASAVQTNKDGAFTLPVPNNHLVLRVRLLGFKSDSLVVDASTARAVRLQLTATATSLSAVKVEAQRASGTAVSLAMQRIADNLKNLTVAEEIRALPNANAADAVSRLPGVSLQRHEGEGSYIQVRGIDGNLSNITFNGAHIAGNADDKGGGGSRAAKMDGIPAELLAKAQVSKTLTADQDADAIGGSVNLETKTANDAPGLNVIGMYGRSDLRNAPTGQGAMTFGARLGADKQFGFFLGGSYDRNNRVYDDVEPSYGYRTFNGQQVIAPIGTSRREYFTHRRRSGVAFSSDYRFDDRTTLNLKGLWTRFDDAAIRYRQDQNQVLANLTPTGENTGTSTGGNITSNVQQRTPIDQNYMLGLSGTAAPGPVALDYAASVTQTELVRLNAGDITFRQSGLNMTYDRSDPTTPIINPVGTYPTDPSRFALRTYVVANQIARGRDYAGQITGMIPFETMGRTSAFQFGAKFRQERRTFDDYSFGRALKTGQTFTLADVVGGFTNPNHYNGRLPLGIAPDDKLSQNYITNTNASKFAATPGDTLTSLLNVYTGRERIAAGYGAYTVDLGAWHWVTGVRVEATQTNYTANKAVTDRVTKLVTVVPVDGDGSYVNFFPSAQLRRGLNEQTNFRVAVTTGIARPLYYDLAPHTSVTPGAAATDPNAVNLGNPDLKPTRSINYDALIEHFSSDVGVAQIGVFYKTLKDFIYNQNFTYVGAPFDGYNAIQPRNGKDGYIYGFEGALVRRLAFLPGVLNGVGIDANATYVQSRSNIEGRVGKPFPRQANWNGNAALTYAKGIVSSRVTMQYNGAYIYTLGGGSASVATGDTYMLAHKQIDASLNVQVQRNAQVVLQVLNINNAPFGYFFGGDVSAYKQREFYGTTTSLQIRYTM